MAIPANKLKPQSLQGLAGRHRLLIILLLFGFIVLFSRGIYLQGMEKEFLQKQGEQRYYRNLKLSAKRGNIFDRNGNLLASSQPVGSVWANPKDVWKDWTKGVGNRLRQPPAPYVQLNEDNQKQLATLLNMPLLDLQKQLGKTHSGFVYLKHYLSPKQLDQVMALRIYGIDVQRDYKRYYPEIDVMSPIIGFTGLDDSGQEGIELFENNVLAGTDGSRRVLKNGAGNIIEDVEAVKLPEDGKHLVLTIDKRIQYLAFRELGRAVEKYRALAGAAVVLDAKTGEVLAMANVPSYNPNADRSGKVRNRAITDVFEPGSTIKPFTAAVALEMGKYQPNSQIDTAPGTVKIGNRTIHDSHQHGVLTLAEIIQKSSNVGITKVALALPAQAMWKFFRALGLGNKTRIEFPGEVSGRLIHYAAWHPIEQATISFGHGINLTLLQLARAYSVFANGGELKPVSLLKSDVPAVGTQVFSAQVAQQVKGMLEMAVLTGGTAVSAQILGYRVAGKTGTAKKLGVHGYEKRYVSSFVGMVPASNPRFIMAVMIDEPRSGDYYGGTVAAPVFSATMSEVLRMLSVPQDAPQHNVVIPSDDEDAKEDV